jgi:hypothetical protein
VEGFNPCANSNYWLSRSLDTEDCNIKLGISPTQDKKTDYTATLEHDVVFPGTQAEKDSQDAIYNSQNMLEKYFIINKRR